MMDQNNETLALDWIIGPDTGLSSKCIWAAMMGRPQPVANCPHDLDDFGRCWRLLALIPGWRDRLSEMAEHYSEWAPLVREWEKLETIYERFISATDMDDRAAIGAEGYKLLLHLCGEMEHSAMPEQPA